MAKDVSELFPVVWAGEPAGVLLAAKPSPSHREGVGKGETWMEFPYAYLDPQFANN